MIKWNGGIIPERRYAIFNDVVRGKYLIVVKGDDLLTTHKWGGFITWIGTIKPSETRKKQKKWGV